MFFAVRYLTTAKKQQQNQSKKGKEREMRKKKKVLSFLTAAALFVSSLSGSYVSVNAATVDVYTAVTDANGQAQVVLPDGTYDVEVSKLGYEHTAGGDDSAKSQLTVAGADKTEEFQISKKEYTATPGKVTIGGGVALVSAPERGADAATTAAFTASVADQFDMEMNADAYTAEWSIYPAGTTTADAAVTIDANGIVSVTSDYASENKITDFDVVCKATANGESAEGVKTLKVGTSDVVDYASVNWEQPGGGTNRGGSVNLESAIDLPDLSSVAVGVQFPTGTDGQVSLAIISGSAKLAGLQLRGDNKLYAWTGWNSNTAMNQSGDLVETVCANSGLLLENYDKTKPVSVTFIIDKINHQIKVSADYEGANEVLLPFTVNADQLTGFQFGHYRTYGAVKVNDIFVSKVNANYLEIVGQNAFAKVSGVTVTKEYTLSQSVVSAGEAFEWSVVSNDTQQAADGVTIEDGILSVTDAAESGVYTIHVVSEENAEKKASFEITVADFQNVDLVISGAGAMQTGDEKVYGIASAMDQFGDQLPDELLSAATWTSSDTQVISVEKSAELSPGEATATAVKAGKATLKVEVTNGTVKSEKSVEVTVADYYLVKDVTNGSAAITAEDKANLITNTNIVGYQVTTAKADGTVVTSEFKEAVPDTVSAQGADKVEIAPVYEYEVNAPGKRGEGKGFSIAVPDDTYNFTITDNGTNNRYDVYANDQMIVNNFLQNGTTPNTIDVKDIVIKGNVNITTDDSAAGDSAVKMKVRLTKAPSIVNRTQKVYVLGDSLVAIYYNGGSADNNKKRTGWGQVLQSYMKNVDVVDLANSGVTAKGLLDTAFSLILGSAQPGDLFVLESGYNDANRDKEHMIPAVTEMATKAKALGVDVVLVSPNASAHDYKESVARTADMAKVAADTNTPYLDLSKRSYTFLNQTYGTDETIKNTVIFPTYNMPAAHTEDNKDDTLHSSFRGANKWASIVAGGLIDLGFGEIVNTEYSYKFTDEAGTEITCQAAATPEATASVKAKQLSVSKSGVSVDETVKAADAQVYVDETFDSYETQEIIAAGTENAPDSVTLGSLIFNAGNRKSGMACKASVAAADDNKYLSIDEDAFATAGRGVKFEFAESANIPTADSIAAGSLFELSMDVFSYSRGVETGANYKPFSNEILGFGEIPELKDMTNVKFRAIIDKANSKQYILVTDAAGRVLVSTIEELTATGFTGMQFYAPLTKASIDNLKVEQKASDIGLVTFTVKDKDGNPVDGATVAITKEGEDITPADKAALQALYDEVKDYEESEYTAETWADFAAARKNAEDVLADENATDEAIKSAFDALTLAKENLEPSTPNPENPDLAAFEQYKKDQCAAADAMAAGAPAGADALITQAKNAINAVAFGTDLASSKQAVDAIIAKLKTDIENLKNSGNPSNTDAEIFANYKAQKVQEAAALAVTGDSAAVTALIENAKNAINAIAFDAGKSLADNQAAVDAVIAKLKTDVAAQRAADQKPVTPPADQTPKKNETFKYKNATYKITAIGKKAAVTMTVAPNVKKAVVPDTVPYKKVNFKVTAIAANACKSIKKTKIESLTIGKNVTTIGKKAFAKSTKLKTVTIGAGVTKIDNEAFSGCSKLKTITVKSTKIKTVGKNAFKNTAKNAKFTFPKKKFDAYKKKTFKNKGQNKKATYKKGK